MKKDTYSLKEKTDFLIWNEKSKHRSTNVSQKIKNELEYPGSQQRLN